MRFSLSKHVFEGLVKLMLSQVSNGKPRNWCTQAGLRVEKYHLHVKDGEVKNAKKHKSEELKVSVTKSRPVPSRQNEHSNSKGDQASSLGSVCSPVTGLDIRFLQVDLLDIVKFVLQGLLALLFFILG